MLLAAPTLLLILLRTFPGSDPAWFSANGHMVIVSAIAACALFVAVVAVVSATQTPQAGVVWLALGCSFVGLFMVGHGLSTPGALHHHGYNMWVGRLPYLALTGFAVWRCGQDERPGRSRRSVVGGADLPRDRRPASARRVIDCRLRAV